MAPLLVLNFGDAKSRRERGLAGFGGVSMRLLAISNLARCVSIRSPLKRFSLLRAGRHAVASVVDLSLLRSLPGYPAFRRLTTAHVQTFPVSSPPPLFFLFEMHRILVR